MAPADLLLSLPWLAPLASLPRLADHTPDLESVPPETGQLVSVIIPARNEAITIETAVRSVLATTYQPLEVIVVDDRSKDSTAAIVERLAAEEPRLRLLRGQRLPDGWYGKPWACYQGACAAGGELLLFTDADTRHEPELLGRAVGALRQLHVDLVTVSPHQRCVSFWERLVMPQVWFLLGLRFHPRLVNRARRERDVIANGQFILVTREAYELTGTHSIVRHEVAEDLALAQAFFRGRRKIYFAFARRLMETRMYRSLPELVEGWSKNAYLGGRRSFPNEPILRALVPLMLVVAALFWLVPPSALALWSNSSIGLPALAATGLSVIFWMLISRGMEIPSYYGLLYPVGAAARLYIKLRSIARGRRRVEGKGRVYRR